MKDENKPKLISPVVIPFFAVMLFMIFLSVWYCSWIIPKYTLSVQSDKLADDGYYYSAITGYDELIESGFDSKKIIDKQIKACFYASDFSGIMSALKAGYTANYSGFAQKGNEEGEIFSSVALYAYTSEVVESVISEMQDDAEYENVKNELSAMLGQGYDDSVIYFYLAVIAEEEENLNECTDYLKKAYEENTNDALFAYALGSKYIFTKCYDDAVNVLEDFAKRNKEPEILHNLAIAYLLKGELDSARENAELAENISHGEYKLFTLSIIYGLSGDTAKYESTLEKLSESSGEEVAELVKKLCSGDVKLEDYYLASDPEEE